MMLGCNDLCYYPENLVYMKPILMNNNTIIKGHVSKDHIHVLVSATTSLSMSRLVPKLKGASSHKLFQEYAHLRK